MPRGDYRRRETKKPKKEVKKAASISTLLSTAVQPPVETIKTKGKRQTEEEES